MFSFIKGLFGSSKNTDTVVETAAKGIYNGIDMLVYTDEEKALASAKGVDKFLEFVGMTSDQNSIRSVARRWLAFMVVGPVMLDVVIASIFYTLAPFFQNFAENGDALYNPFKLAGDNLVAVIAIVAPWAGGVLMFYFGPHIVGAFKK